MFSNSRRIISSVTLFNRACSTQSIESMLSQGKRLTDARKFTDAKQVYEKVMDKFPARHEGYDGYYYSIARTSGIFGPSQRLFDHLQSKYFEAVEKDRQMPEVKLTSPRK